jgi:glycosyltransferase involved in cell wall biosynthesis
LRKHVIEQGIAPERVHVLPNGVDPGLFYPAAAEPSGRARLGLAAGPVIGFVGGLRPWHGVEVLPELLQKLTRGHPTVQMLIAGDGPLRATLKADFQKRRLSNRVRFTGTIPHDQIPAIIRHFDIALAPYPRLNHDFYFSPLKIFEYMACGIPVVASACGQISELIKSGKTGLLCRPQRVTDLTAACDRLLRNPSLRQRLGQSACKLVHTHYTWDHNARRATDLARSLLRTKATGTSKDKQRGPLPQKRRNS